MRRACFDKTDGAGAAVFAGADEPALTGAGHFVLKSWGRGTAKAARRGHAGRTSTGPARRRNEVQYISRYRSPLGEMLLAADEIGLTGLWFAGQKHFARRLDREHEERGLPLFDAAKRWLDVYFSGREPDVAVPLHFTGTAFENEVWELLCAIPYGQTTTYGAIARQLAARRGLPRMSAQAVGGAVGRNEISIIVPCHRVVGADGSLTGYAGGIGKKARLLALEHVDLRRFSLPNGGAAL